ncbi:MAG: hypothetical protein CMP46_04315 [Rickettsiales bacterium]|nr:hypothetical protein [Rickettsiales bacterium]
MTAEIYKNLILKKPRTVIAVLVLVLCFFASFIKDFKLDASADSLILEDDQDLKIFRETSERYDSNEFLVVTYSPKEDLFDEKSLSTIEQLSADLKTVNNVESVTSILDVPLLKMTGLELADITKEKILYLKDKNINKEKAKEEILSSPVFKDLILSQDSKTTALIVSLERNQKFYDLIKKRDELRTKKRSAGLSEEEEENFKDVIREYETLNEKLNNQRHQNIIDTRNILSKYKSTANLHLGGVPMIADDMISFIKSDLRVFGIGVLIFILGTLAFIFRKIRWIALPLLSCFYAVLIMIGLVGFLNWKVTVISSNFISLMLILTMSMNIHLVVRYQQLRRKNNQMDQINLIELTVKKMVLPCLYTALTTIFAFTSLVFSNIKPVIDFGWMMTAGLTITFLTSFLLFPSILALLKKTEQEDAAKSKSFITHGFAQITEKYGKTIFLISLCLCLISGLGISKLKVENSFINYFDEKTEIYQGMKLIDEKLGGTTPLDVLIKFDSNNEVDLVDDPDLDEEEFEDPLGFLAEEVASDKYWFTSDKVNKIKDVHDYLDTLPEVGKVMSLASTIRLAEGLNKGKELDNFELEILFKKIPDDVKSSIVDPFLSKEDNEARINIRILDSRPDIRRNELIKKIRNGLTSQIGLKEDETVITGILVLYNNMLQSLFKSQILTLGYVMLGIAFMFLVLFRSFPLAVIGIAPNVLAAAIVLGIMGIMEIPLDMMTITIAAITIGIAVDNSIHYIYRFREEFRSNKNYLETMKICHQNIGRAILNTSITIIFGFSILILSNFIPTILFGTLTGLAMFIAMSLVLTLLPKLLMTLKPNLDK